ncbi:hypothetical protein RSAG8_10599, partial [Rhizoctonia solani AG-8 WAC10335]
MYQSRIYSRCSQALRKKNFAPIIYPIPPAQPRVDFSNDHHHANVAKTHPAFGYSVCGIASSIGRKCASKSRRAATRRRRNSGRADRLHECGGCDGETGSCDDESRRLHVTHRQLERPHKTRESHVSEKTGQG